ncbi:hypothetical protein R6Q59_006395 [Mikania micrantha]
MRDCLQFGDKATDPVELDHDLVHRTVYQMGHEALGMDFNYSKMIFRDMHANIKGKRKERFLAFPRFIQIVINKRHPNAVPTIGTLGIKRMREDIFSYMMMNKRGKKQYVGERPLIKFGRFVGYDAVTMEQGTPVAIIT